MKKIKILGLIITLIMIFFSCEELPDPAGLRGVAVVPGISNLDPGIFDSKDLVHSYVEFLVSVPDGSHVDKITILGSSNDNNEEVAITEITTFPATVRILSSDAAQKLGINLNDINNGDTFVFELLTTADGTTTRSSAVLFIPVACAYDVNLATGSYHTISSDWNSEGDITLTADANDPYTIYVAGIEAIEGVNEDQGPLVMHIDPATYAVTADLSVIASEAFGFGSISYSGTGVYSSCDGSYSMLFDISLSALGSVGLYTFSFTRN
jgi:hypothetical protein